VLSTNYAVGGELNKILVMFTCSRIYIRSYSSDPFNKNKLFGAQAGPESAGAHPGPVCYRKGGHLAITDANLVLGRILPDFFPKIFGPHEDEPLDGDAARSAG
jgi:Hydantoinase/oxoprolinase